jgi:hypothetical protein
MLLHIRPQYFLPTADVVSLAELRIDPFGLVLRGDIEVATRKPYPNKGWKVSCRKGKTTKAVDGILLETSKPIDEFGVTAIWCIAAEWITTKRTLYKILDHDFDLASDDQMLWYALTIWDREKQAEEKIGLDRVPKCEQPKPEFTTVPTQHASCGDLINEQGLVCERRSVLFMPTIERERLTDPRFAHFRPDRRPTLDQAFCL